MVTTRPPKTIVKPTALGPVANTDTKLLIYVLFQKGRVLAQDGTGGRRSFSTDLGTHPGGDSVQNFHRVEDEFAGRRSHGCLPFDTRSSFLRITPADWRLIKFGARGRINRKHTLTYKKLTAA